MNYFELFIGFAGRCCTNNSFEINKLHHSKRRELLILATFLSAYACKLLICKQLFVQQSQLQFRYFTTHTLF